MEKSQSLFFLLDDTNYTLEEFQEFILICLEEVQGNVNAATKRWDMSVIYSWLYEMQFFLLTGKHWAHSRPVVEYEFKKAFRIYSFSPPSIQKVLDPLISEWKQKIFRTDNLNKIQED